MMMMMRLLLAVPLVAACASSAASGGDSYDSVRDRLADGSTRLFVGGTDSAGVVTARQWTSSGWIEGDRPLLVDTGELSASVDGDGKLALQSFEVGIAPLEIPEDVFHKPAQLSDVRVTLTAPTSGAATWTSEDAATARISMALDLDWSITVNGGKTPLGKQHLPPIDVDLTLGGDGDVVEAKLALAATGDLWSWAGLIELTHLELNLAAETVD